MGRVRWPRRVDRGSIMQKFVNPDGIVAHFEGPAVSELARHDPARHRLPVKVTLRGKKGIEDVENVDAFNVLDFFILTTKMADAIDSFTKRQWPRRRAFVYDNNQRLGQEYCVLVLDRIKKVGVLTATEADWTPDANYPVMSNALVEDHLALDAELKFPVVSDQLVAHLKDTGFNFYARSYPVKK